MKKNNGYLICNNCFGYYKLKENESPEDFNGCECGSPLVYRENIDNLRTNISNSASKFDSSYNEPENDSNAYDDHNDGISDVLSVESKEHEQYLEKLQETILNQDVVLEYIQEEQMMDGRYDKLPVWDIVEEKKIENELDTRMMNDMMEKENLFQFYIKNKRESESLRYNYSHLKIGFVILLIAFLALIVIYAIK
jgi:hypothetical protein